MQRHSFVRQLIGLSQLYLLGKFSFHISELTTLGVVCYVASRLWYQTHFPNFVWWLVFIVWVLILNIGFEWPNAESKERFRKRNYWLLQCLATGACALVLKTFGEPFSWSQAGAFCILLGASLLSARIVRGIIAKNLQLDQYEGIRFGIAQWVALFAVHPYMKSGLVGAGDAYSYSLMVADFRDQWHSGVFPIFVGQSWFAFNGGFQPIRNAPYFEHLTWILDVASVGTFNSFALQNLTVLVSMVGAIVGCYAALRIFLQKMPWVALSLAILYGLCPGVLAPLYEGDMYLTFMTLPFLTWLVMGLAESAAFPDRLWPWAVQAVALAAMWLAHPPVAAWASVVVIVSACWTLILNPRWSVFGNWVSAAAIFFVLGGYIFVSVYLLQLPVVSRLIALDSVNFKLAILQDSWQRSFLPISRGGNNLLGDIQLGYGLWILLVLAALGSIGGKANRHLLGCFGFVLIFAWPIPLLTSFAWHSLPSILLVVTNQWPVERFYVILAAFATFIAASLFSDSTRLRIWQKWSLSGVLIVSCLWSVTETEKFFNRAGEITHPEIQSEETHLHEGVVLSRTHSNEYLGTPSYFSYGHMDPRLETRLIDVQTRQVFADGATYQPAYARTASEARILILQTLKDGFFNEKVHLESEEGCILKFDFLGRQPEGELQIRGRRFYEFYFLPHSGFPKAFGSDVGNGKTLILENTTKDAEDLSFRFLGQINGNPSNMFARVEVEPLVKHEMVIRLNSLTPFCADVTADRDCYLETPKLFVPGYHALVDGSETPCLKSSEGLVEISLTKGVHAIRIYYLGSRLLRLSYIGSALGWVIVTSVVLSYALSDKLSSRLSTAVIFGLRVKSSALKLLQSFSPRVLLVIFIAALALEIRLRFEASHIVRNGTVEMAIRLPLNTLGRHEPLLTIGRPGAGDFIYIDYVDGTHIIVGHDRWNYGGAKSNLITVDYAKPQTIQVKWNSQYPKVADVGGTVLADDTQKNAQGGLTIKWNGVLILSEKVLAYPSRSNEVTIGENLIGGSSTGPHFSGEILGISAVKLK